MATGGCTIPPIAARRLIGIQPWPIDSTRAGPAQAVALAWAPVQAVALAWAPARRALCVQVREHPAAQLGLARVAVLAWALAQLALSVPVNPARLAPECAPPPDRSSSNSSRRVVPAWEPVPAWVLARPALFVPVRECPAPQLVPAREPVPAWVLARPVLFAAQAGRQVVAR